MTETQLPLDEIQGLILRGYGMDALRVFVLSVENAQAARAVIGAMPVTTSTPWETKPSVCVNIALTCEGLKALELSAESIASFPEEFRAGAVARAAVVGDTGTSSPEQWSALAGSGVHVLVMVYAQDGASLDTESTALRARWRAAMREISIHDARMLPGNVAHFGYRDGFSQPTISGGPPNPIPEPVVEAPAGAFVLGYESQFNAFTYAVPQPPELGRNGSFMAFRILAQDCRAFEELLDTAPALGLDRELLAAKLVGRWRNGTPLALSPHSDAPARPMATEDLNAFDYIDDPKGLRCPVGAHMRRANPRNSLIAGGGGTKHRLVRRGLPYGPIYDASVPDDGIERGLLGIFICVSLKDQFEFVMEHWINGDTFAPGLSGTADPVLGNVPSTGGTMTIPVENVAPKKCTGFAQLVRTRGGTYAFLPSVSALHFIGGLAKQ